MYVMVCTIPYIAYEVGVVSIFLSNLGKGYWNDVKWILRYLRGPAKQCLCFGNENQLLIGYIDGDMAGDVHFRKSTSGYLITFAGGVVSWQSRLQKCIALTMNTYLVNMNTKLVRVYYNKGKLNMFRVHVYVTLPSLKDQVDHINGHLNR